MLLTAACESASLRPVDIEASDMCAYCKMAISERRYAAEAIDNEGTAYKFDNALCMMRFVADRKLRDRVGAWYIADYENRSWLDARNAAFVRSAEIPGPMASGLAAFGSHAAAQALAAEHHGKTISFEGLWTSLQ